MESICKLGEHRIDYYSKINLTHSGKSANVPSGGARSLDMISFHFIIQMNTNPFTTILVLLMLLVVMYLYLLRCDLDRCTSGAKGDY